MKRRHLQAFVAVAEARSFGRAARELNLAQPALSKQVAALERELGAVLFVRGPRDVVLTAAGEAFIGEARSLLKMSERAVARTRAVANSTAGILGPATTDHAVARGRARPRPGLPGHPAPRPHGGVAADVLGGAVGGLRERRLHVGVGYGEPAAGSGLATSTSPTWRSPACSSPLATRWPPVAVSASRTWRGSLSLFFPREVNPPLHDSILAGLRERGLEPKLRPWVHMQSAYETAVGAGHGWMLAARGMPELPDGVVARPIDGPPMATSLSIWWRRDEAGPPVRAFLEAARAVRGA